MALRSLDGRGAGACRIRPPRHGTSIRRFITKQAAYRGVSPASERWTTCYVGVSFFKSATGDKLMTSVAQVFDERGEGLIVQGGSASYDKDDRSPHLSKEDAKELLANGLASYKREHKTMPARLVMHKTSYFNAEL